MAKGELVYEARAGVKPMSAVLIQTNRVGIRGRENIDPFLSQRLLPRLLFLKAFTLVSQGCQGH